MNHDPRMLTRNILRQYRDASPEHIADGLGWYDAAFTECERVAWRHGHTVTQAVVALAHLSPRIGWQRNIELLKILLAGQPKPRGIFNRSWSIASRSLAAEDPLHSFGRTAYKTRSFARAILGDPNAVCVDVWATRVAGAEEILPKSSSGYTALSEAYRRAARRVDGLSPRDLQAITWAHIRGRAN